jgi:CRP-like cAMP-binding protein
MTPSRYCCRNRLLWAMSQQDFARLQPHLEPVALRVMEVLVRENAPIEHVYFIEEGLGSVVVLGPDSEQIEVGHIGYEGVTAEAVSLGLDHSPNRTFVQSAGSALRIGADELTSAIATSPSLKALLLRYVQAVIIQITHSALANGRYANHKRLARWLLMCHDRMAGDDLSVTHEFLALMLGVRRAGVTEALHVLEGQQIIKACRGHIHVLDRAGLEEVAGGCYGVPEAEYAALIGAPP